MTLAVSCLPLASKSASKKRIAYRAPDANSSCAAKGTVNASVAAWWRERVTISPSGNIRRPYAVRPVKKLPCKCNVIRGHAVILGAVNDRLTGLEVGFEETSK